MVTNTEPGSIDSAGPLTHRVCDARGRPAEHEDGHRDEHDEGRAALLLLQGSMMRHWSTLEFTLTNWVTLANLET